MFPCAHRPTIALTIGLGIGVVSIARIQRGPVSVLTRPPSRRRDAALPTGRALGSSETTQLPYL